ncbi:hypothetical protein LEMLEM_LOCUS18386, partial [Lemmus lemmus]
MRRGVFWEEGSSSPSTAQTTEEAGCDLPSCKRYQAGGWRNGSVVKSIACPSKGPEFNSQQPHGGSQPSVMRSGALFW